MRFRISEISKMTGISDSGIRFYERAGIITPQRQKNSKYREYGLREVSILMGCKWYRSCGFSLDKATVMNNETDAGDLSAMLKAHVESIKREIIRKQLLIEVLQQRAEAIESFHVNGMICEIKHNPVLLRLKLWQPGCKNSEYTPFSQTLDWKDITPFSDSCLKFNVADIMNRQGEILSDHGLALEEKYARALCFSPVARVEYIPSRKCVHARVEVREDLTIHSDQLQIVREFIQENQLEVCDPVITQRIFNEHCSVNNRRIDHLWAPIKDDILNEYSVD